MGLTLGSLFDGIAGFPLAASGQGIETVWTSEIEENCIDISTRHFPKAIRLGDITRINGAEIPPVDIISFGSPCQDLSVAGKQAGLSGSRSGLFLEAVRIIREMREKTNGQYPKYIIWENVAGAFSSNKGEDFRRVLEEITESNIPMPASGKWAAAGMVGVRGPGGELHTTAWRRLDAQFWGVPQRRKRIYLVHDFGGGDAGQILFECESLLGYPATGGETPEGSAVDLENSAAGTDSGGLAEEPDGQLTLDFGRTADRIYINAKKSVTLMGRAGGGGGKTGLYLLPVYTIAGNVIGRSEENGGNQLGINQDTAPTLTTNDRHAVVYAAGMLHKASPKVGGISYTEEKTPTLTSQQQAAVVVGYTQNGYAEFKEGVGTLKKSRGAAGGGSETIVVEAIKKIAQTVKYRVRRLTPTECERLDGFPDGWTMYGASGKEMSDNARYMALGNSIAVPCAERVFIGICKVDRERRGGSGQERPGT
ncbi:DNA (cytosine-5-)-methyltransferase [Acetatifactor aquisgranensis]|uniref:DNA (cytosine-5-)-methyltransferase n=1 Tax=Acetatifactor aquisgranensis TaxID=2941233 RepID=UPI0020400559|nr:DNA (cytosine-5-)-methyltransferase [Acetatifactor aquisgranensis]